MDLLIQPLSVVGLFQPLAHQGGWDEILLIVAPLGIIGGLLHLANKRVNEQLQDQTSQAGQSNDDVAS